MVVLSGYVTDRATVHVCRSSARSEVGVVKSNYYKINPLYPVDVCTRHPYTGPEIRMTAVDVIASGDFQRSRLDSTNAHRPVTPPSVCY